MKKSILKKVLWLIAIVLLTADFIFLLLARQTIVSSVEQSLSFITEAAARDVSLILHDVPLVNLREGTETYTKYLESLQEMCDDGGLLYIYVYVPNLETKELTHVMIVCGEGASQKVKEDWKPGTVSSRPLEGAELAALNGNEDTFIHVNNEYGDVLSHFHPIYDSSGNVTALVGVDISVSRQKNDVSFLFWNIFTTRSIALIAVLLVLYVVLKTRVLKPAVEISRRMKNFITDRSIHGEKLPVRGADEFADMAAAFNTMTDEIYDYLKDIESLTREKQKQQSEMEIAAKIQMDMLPPEHFETEFAKVQAFTRPAKLVGGDFYDYFQIGDNLLFTVIADVSGKGITGALLMAKTITAIRQSANFAVSPAQILKDVNALICENNSEMMFVTVFIGVYDKTTGAYTYANAGHTPPFFLNGHVEKLEGEHGVALGLFEDETYEEQAIQLLHGDIIFLYTDGVSEAVNPEHLFFGIDGITNALDCHSWGEQGSCVELVLNDLAKFQRDAEQFDDITMLSFALKPDGGLFLKAERENLTQIFEQIKALTSLTPKTRRRLCLIAEEVFINICNYAYGDKTGWALFSVIVNDDIITLHFVDAGKPFNPLENRQSIENYDIDTQIGGLGLELTMSLSDEVIYEFTNNKNTLTIKLKNSEVLQNGN